MNAPLLSPKEALRLTIEHKRQAGLDAAWERFKGDLLIMSREDANAKWRNARLAVFAEYHDAIRLLRGQT